MTFFLISIATVFSLPTAAPKMRDALFFCEQRAGRVGYIGWPPLSCTTDVDCKGVNGSYCMNYKNKTAPFFCHEPEVFLATGLAKPVGIAVDSDNQKVFYDQDDQSQGNTAWPVSQVAIGGGSHPTNVLEKLVDPQGIDVDSDNKILYYVEHHGQRIGSIKYDGTDKKTLAEFTGKQYPSDVKVDSKNGYIFALVETDLSTGGRLVSMHLDGSNMTTLVNDITRAYGLTFSTKTETLYYISGGHGGFIGNVSYDGKTQGRVLEGLEWPYMLDYDSQRDYLVFSETGVGDGTLKTVTTDGLNVTESLSLGFAPMGVAFGQVPMNN